MSSLKTHLTRAAETSAIIGTAKKIARRVAAADARVAAGIQWRPAEQKREQDWVATIASTSRVVRTLESGVLAFAGAWNGAAVRRLADSVAALTVEDRSRMIGVVLVAAALTHTSILAVLDVPVHALGWATRAVLLAAGTFAFLRADALATAWKAKFTR